MPTTAAPYGARPVGTLSSSGSFNGKISHIPIATTYNTDIFFGDFVKIVNSGTVEKASFTTAVDAGIVGVFMGCAYTDPTSGYFTNSQYWPANNAATDAVAYVADDPNLVFMMQADEAIAQTGLGNNVAMVETAGSTSIGTSKNALDGGSIATTNTLPLRILGFVDGPDQAVGDSFTDCLVTYLPGSHAYKTALGV